MSYRLLKLTTVYPAYAATFEARNPDWRTLSYAELLARFVATRYGLSDAFAFELARLGNEAAEVFASLAPLQRAWAREHGMVPRDHHWVEDIAIAQVRDYRPDVVYLQDLYAFGPAFRSRLRVECPSVRLVVGWRAAPTEDFAEFGDLDLLFTASPGLLERFRAAGARAELVPLGFDARVLSEVPVNITRDLALTFAGQLSSRGGWFAKRGLLMSRMVADTPIELWALTPPPRTIPKRAAQTLIYATGLALRKESRLARVGPLARLAGFASRYQECPWPREVYETHSNRFHPAVFGLDYYCVLARSRTTLNVHIDAVSTHATNLRLYEATGMGACLLTDWKPNLCELFDLDTEIVAYRSVDECVEKAKYLLTHDDESRRIAEAGQRRTLRDHTLEDRVRRVDALIVKALSASASR